MSVPNTSKTDKTQTEPVNVIGQQSPFFNTGLFLRPETTSTLGVPIDVMSFVETQERILRWARARDSRYVVHANAHVVVSATRDALFFGAVAGADVVTPDGAPVAWMLRALGNAGQKRISGPDLMWALLKCCASEALPIYFYGSTDDTVRQLKERLTKELPSLCICGAEAPPFRPSTAKEDQEAIERINSSGAALVFVGLGCPKQEHWMLAHRGSINAVMLGVGAAFDFHAGVLSRAPKWMQEHGLEWLFRLGTEPRRLWKRYLITNTRFLVGAAVQLLKQK